MDKKTEQINWTTVVKSQRPWFDINFGELWQYRDLIMLFVRRDFVAIYKQTILGPLWFMLQPLISTAIFTIVFGQVAKIPTDGVPPILFYLSGIIIWNFFSSCLTKGADVFISNAGIFGKVYFPRLSVPLSTVLTNLMTLAIQLSLFIGFIVYFMFKGALIQPNLYIFWTPLLFLMVGALGIGFGMIVSAITTRYRDLSFLVGFGVQLWMYATPIVYPLSQVPVSWRWLYAMNPMVVMVEMFRYAFTGVGTVDLAMIISSIAITLVTVATGLAMFSRIEKTFIDTI